MERKCGYKRSDVWLYIQNRMSREEEAEFQLHLLHCKECRAELEQLRSIVHSIDKKERRGVSFRVWMLAASVACIMIGGGLYWNYYSGLQQDVSLPDVNHEFEVNPPVLHNDYDSIAPQDTIPEDTMQINRLD